MNYNITLSISEEALEVHKEIPSGQRSKLYETALLMLKKKPKTIDEIKHHFKDSEGN
jgi:predicted transcriptional regulator